MGTVELLDPLSQWQTLGVWIAIVGGSGVIWLIVAKSGYNAGVGSVLTNYGLILLWIKLASFGFLPPMTAPDGGRIWSILFMSPPLLIAALKARRGEP